jgi:hypothetical protein
MIHLTIDLIVLIIAILAGFISFVKTDLPYLKMFPFFLLLILLVEFTGQLTQKPGQNNVLLFNLFSVVEFFFFSYFFSQVIHGIAARKYVRLSGWSLSFLSLLNIFFIQGTKAFHTYTYVLGCLVMVTFGIIYFYECFNSKTKTNLFRDPSFWISIGIVFFFVCSVSVIGALNYISLLPKVIVKNLNTLLLIVDALFYLSFIIAFLCKTNIRRSLSSS